MITISSDMTIELQPGLSEYTVDSDREISLDFTCQTKASVFIRTVCCAKLTIHTVTKNGGNAAYLFWNAADSTQNYEEKHEVQKDSSLRIAYCECSMNDSRRISSVNLNEPGAGALISSASLVSSETDYTLDVVSNAPHTSGIMENYAVVLSGGHFYLDATGSIKKGAHGSESHQTSRALCFDEGQASTIKPKLLIDEHDVQASHATTVGRVNEDQLYYMESRGLTQKQCTGLISTGYLMPAAEVIEDEELKKTLKKELEGKIAELCLM